MIDSDDDDVLLNNDQHTAMGPINNITTVHIIHKIINGTFEYVQYMNFSEIYDKRVLQLILQTDPAVLKLFLSPGKQNTKYINALYPLLQMYDKYDCGNEDGSKNIWYKHARYDNAALERIYAVGGASLQCFSRPIRGALAASLYYDIDISNCFPTILLFICVINNIEPNKYCALQTYVRDRNTDFIIYYKLNIFKNTFLKCNILVLVRKWMME
eukprot:80116_1